MCAVLNLVAFTLVLGPTAPLLSSLVRDEKDLAKVDQNIYNLLKNLKINMKHCLSISMKSLHVNFQSFMILALLIANSTDIPWGHVM